MCCVCVCRAVSGVHVNNEPMRTVDNNDSNLFFFAAPLSEERKTLEIVIKYAWSKR